MSYTLQSQIIHEAPKHGGAMDDTFYFDTGDQDINDKTPTSLVDGYDFVGLV